MRPVRDAPPRRARNGDWVVTDARRGEGIVRPCRCVLGNCRVVLLCRAFGRIRRARVQRLGARLFRAGHGQAWRRRAQLLVGHRRPVHLRVRRRPRRLAEPARILRALVERRDPRAFGEHRRRHGFSRRLAPSSGRPKWRHLQLASGSGKLLRNLRPHLGAPGTAARTPLGRRRLGGRIVHQSGRALRVSADREHANARRRARASSHVRGVALERKLGRQTRHRRHSRRRARGAGTATALRREAPRFARPHHPAGSGQTCPGGSNFRSGKPHAHRGVQAVAQD